MPKSAYYAVAKGKKTGIYHTWDETVTQVSGFAGAKHKKFTTRQQAEEYLTQQGVPIPCHPSTSASATASTSTSHTHRPVQPAPHSRARQDTANKPAHRLPDYKQDRPKQSAKRSGARDELVGSAVANRKVYCDGSSLGNGKHGAAAGMGVWWSNEIGAPNLAERLPGSIQTNNRAEMYAVARILESDPTPHLPLTICSDSQYTISVFSDWIHGWKRNGWRNSSNQPVSNKDLILYIIALLAARSPPINGRRKPNVSFMKVKAHCGIEGNERADQFAKSGAMQAAVPERDYEAEAEKVERRARVKKEELELEFEIDEGDLLTDDELRRLSEEQNF